MFLLKKFSREIQWYETIQKEIICPTNLFFCFKTVSVDAVVYFRIFNPIISVTNVENSRYSTQLLAATTLRNIL